MNGTEIETGVKKKMVKVTKIADRLKLLSMEELREITIANLEKKTKKYRLIYLLVVQSYL